MTVSSCPEVIAGTVAAFLVALLAPALGLYGILEALTVAIFNYPAVGLLIWRWPVFPAVNVPSKVVTLVWRILLCRDFPYRTRSDPTTSISPVSSESSSRDEKAGKLWNDLSADQRSELRPGFLGQVLRIIVMPVRTVLRRTHADLSPEGHFKAIHRQGVVARAAIEWEPWVTSTFTGIFASGADECVLRLSWAVKPSEGARVAGAAIKCFRDGVPSANVLFLNTILQSQHTANLLELPLCTHMPLPSSSQNAARKGARTWRQAGLFDVRAGITGAKFIQALRETIRRQKPQIKRCRADLAERVFGMIGLSDMARYDQSGQEHGAPTFPFAIVLQPNPSLRGRVDRALSAGCDSLDALCSALRTAEGDQSTAILYRVYIVPALEPSALRFAGVVRLRSGAHRSLLGDRRLLFHHTMITDDAIVGGSGGDTAQRWLYQLVHGRDRRYEYEGLPAVYERHLPAWPEEGAASGAAAFDRTPPRQCILQETWENERAPSSERSGVEQCRHLLVWVSLLVIGVPLLLAAAPLVLAATLSYVLVGGRAARMRVSGTIKTLGALATASGGKSLPPPHRSLFSLPFDNAAAQLLVSRSLPFERYASLGPTGVWGVWGHEGLSVFYSEFVARDPSTWKAFPAKPPVGLVQTVWGTRKASTGTRKTSTVTAAAGAFATTVPKATDAEDDATAPFRTGCCPMSTRVQLAALEYGLPPLDGLAHRVRKERFVKAMQSQAVLQQVQRVARRELSKLTDEMRHGKEVKLTDRALMIVAHLTCEAFFGMAVSDAEASSLGAALEANFSPFDSIASRLRWGAASVPAMRGHSTIFAFMRRALRKAREERSITPDAATETSATSLLYAYLVELGDETMVEEALLSDLYHIFNGGYAFARCMPQLAFVLQAIPDALLTLRREAAAVAQASPSEPEELAALSPCAHNLALETLRYFNGVQLVFGTATKDIPRSQFVVAESGKAHPDNSIAIPKGDFLAAFLYATCRGAQHDKPDFFWPGRWRGRASKAPAMLGSVEGFTPFGAGDPVDNHRCGGERIALLVMPILAMELAAAWNWQLDWPSERPVCWPLFATWESRMPIRRGDKAQAAVSPTHGTVFSCIGKSLTFWVPWILAALILATLTLPPLVVVQNTLLVILFVVWHALLPTFVWGFVALRRVTPENDWFERILLVQWRVLNLVRRIPTAARLTPSGIKTRMPLIRRPMHSWRGAPRISVPPLTEDDFPEPLLALRPVIFLNRVMHYLPLTDNFTPFSQSEDAEEYVHLHVGDVYPPSEAPAWTDKLSDEALTRFCLYGMAAHRVECDIDGASGCRVFVVRANQLASLPVRPGYSRYGADAYFDEDWRVIKIVRLEVSGDVAAHAGPSGAARVGPHQLVERTYLPTDEPASWSYAKFVFRSSMFTLVTVVDHLFELHLALSTAGAVAFREQLSASHPVRRFLTPFFFQTMTVNDRAHDLLVQEQTMASRTLAFTADGLQAAWDACPSLVASIALQPGGVQELNGRGALERLLRIVDRERYLIARFAGGVDTPYERQSLRLYRAFKRFISAFVRATYPSAAQMTADMQLVGFVEQLLRTWSNTSGLVATAAVAAARMATTTDGATAGSGLPSKESTGEGEVVIVSALPPEVFEELCVCLIATVCDRVSAGHEQMGHLAPYAKDPKFCAWRWPVGEASGNKQSAICQAILTSFTFMPMPRLLAAPGSTNDWSHLFDGLTSEAALKETYIDFQAELVEISKECDEYNATAPSRPFPYCWGLWTVHPRLLEMSVNL